MLVGTEKITHFQYRALRSQKKGSRYCVSLWLKILTYPEGDLPKKKKIRPGCAKHT